MQKQSDQPRVKLKKKRLTGLFKKENQYGVFYTGSLEDGTQLVVHPPYRDENTVVKENGPDLVLSVLVPADESTESKE